MKKVIISEGNYKRLLDETISRIGVVNEEVSPEEAYEKFYSSGKNFVQQDIFNKLMKGATAMTPYHKLALNRFLAGKINANGLYELGDIWNSSSLEARQYLVNIAKNDQRATFGDMLLVFARRVQDMKSHTEKSFNDRGFEVLLEENGVRITTTKSYTASCKMYGKSHWCTASDMYGEWNGLEMFRNYTSDGGCLVQFLFFKKGKQYDAYQVAYTVFGGKPSATEIFDWDDNSYDNMSEIWTLMEAHGVSHDNFYNNILTPNIRRIIAETKENFADECEYYQRQYIIRETNLLNKVICKMNSKDFEERFLELIKDKQRSPERHDPNGEFGCYLVFPQDSIEAACMGDIIVYNVCYYGTGNLRDLISKKVENEEDEKWINASLGVWCVSKDKSRIIRKIKGESPIAFGNLVVLGSVSRCEAKLVDGRTGNIICRGFFDGCVEPDERYNTITVEMNQNEVENGEDRTITFDAITGERIPE